jgi:hypothetical protein
MSTPLPPPVIDRQGHHRRRWNRLELWLAMLVGAVAAFFLYVN